MGRRQLGDLWWCVIGVVVAASLGIDAIAQAQARAKDHGARTGQPATEFHRRTDQPTPREVMAWLQEAATPPATDAAQRQAPAQPGPSAPKPPPPRPGGAGRWVVAVLVDAELDVEPHAVLGVPRRDVLVLSSPGPVARPEELALLEHAVREQRLALCVVMVREGPTPACAEHDTPAARALRRRLSEARAEADRAGATPAVWHAGMQASALTTASGPLRDAARRGLLRTAVAVLPARGQGVRWLAPWFAQPTTAELIAEQMAADGNPAVPAPANTVQPGPPVPYRVPSPPR